MFLDTITYYEENITNHERQQHNFNAAEFENSNFKHDKVIFQNIFLLDITIESMI